MFGVSALMVLLQSCSALAICMAIATPSCITSKQCDDGRFCVVGFTNRCQFCGSNPPLHMQTDPSTGKTYNAIYDANFAGFNNSYVREFCTDPTIARCEVVCPPEGVEQGSPAYLGHIDGNHCVADPGESNGGCYGDGINDQTKSEIRGFMAGGQWGIIYSIEQIHEWCNHCVYAETQDVKTDTIYYMVEENVSSMSSSDWATLFFASCVVALQISGELKGKSTVAFCSRDPVRPSSKALLSPASARCALALCVSRGVKQILHLV